MHIKHFLCTSADILSLVSTALLYGKVLLRLEASEAKGGNVPMASLNWDLTGSINLLPLFLALSYFFMAMETRMEIYVSFTLT
jgi:hypothetical protein